MRGQSGVDFTTGNVLRIFAVLVAAFLIAGIFLSVGGGIEGLKQQLCKLLPQLCQRGTEYEYAVSKRSTCYLTCAMNSVILGKQQDCSRCDEELSPLTGMATASVPLTPSTSLDCNSGQGGTVQCKITDFYLPENLGGLFNEPKEQIEGFGDPSFLVYFQEFPKGEDASWSSYEAWWQGIGEAAIWAVPAIGGLKAIGKPLAKGAKMTSYAKNPAKGAKALYDYGARKAKVLGQKKVFSQLDNIETTVTKGGLWKNMDEFVDENVYAISKSSLKTEGLNLFTRIYRERTNRAMFRHFAEQGYDPKYLVSRLRKPTGMVDDFYVYGGEFADEVALSLSVNKEWDKVTRKLEDVFDDMLKNYGNKQSEIFKQVDVFKYLDEPMQREMFQIVFKDLKYDVAKKVMVYAGITSLAAYVGQRFECEEQKQITKPNQLVIQRPLACSPGDLIEYSLEQNFDGGTSLTGSALVTIPGTVTLSKWENKVGSNPPTPFYLASPCRTDLIIQRRPHQCEYYSYEAESGDVTCTDVKVLDYDEKYKYPSCGLGESEHEYVNGYYGIVEKLYSTQDRRLFEERQEPFGSSTITLMKVYIPTLIKEDGTIPYIELNYSHIHTEYYTKGSYKGRFMTYTYYDYSFEGNNLGKLECYYSKSPEWDDVFKTEIFKDPEDYKKFMENGEISGIKYDIVAHEWGTGEYPDRVEQACRQNCAHIDVYEYSGPDRFLYCASVESYKPPRPKDALTWQPDSIEQEEFYDYCANQASLKDSLYCKNADIAKKIKIRIMGNVSRAGNKFYEVILEVEKTGKILGIFGGSVDKMGFNDMDIFENTDGNWNQFYLDVKRGDNYMFSFSDYDSDGTVDFIESENCIVDGLDVSLDKDSFEEYTEAMKKADKGNHNFCYTKTDTWRVVTSTGLIVLTWAGEIALAFTSAPAASLTIPLAQGVMAYTYHKLKQPTHWPDH